MTAALHLDAASVEAVAQRVAELLGGDSAGALVDAATLAEQLGTSREFVYDNADRLGAVRLSDSGRARLRFDPEVVRERLRADRPDPPKPRRRSRQRTDTAALLPVKGGRP